MSKFDEYRRYAEEAQRQANRAKTDQDKAAWLRLVEGWMFLLSKQKISAEAVFDARAAPAETVA
jgi:hypothetical protein